jgi:hypothetical protein
VPAAHNQSLGAHKTPSKGICYKRDKINNANAPFTQKENLGTLMQYKIFYNFIYYVLLSM